MHGTTLAQIAEHVGAELPVGAAAVVVTGITQDHRRVTPGDLFVAGQGLHVHAIDFARQAVEAGAVAVFSDRVDPLLLAPQLEVANPKAWIGSLCNLVYEPIRARLWAVTGTNGKTSTVTYLYRLLTELGHSVAMSGSTGFFPGAEVSSEGLTTPEGDVIHRQIRVWQQGGVTDVVLEVSAQALVRNRVDGLRFAMSGFTNLSHDHLDDFATMHDYLIAKARLFEPDRTDASVITIGDAYGLEMYNACIGRKSSLLIDHPTEPPGGRVPLTGYHLAEVSGKLILSGGSRSVELPLGVGKLMARNLALAITMLLQAGIEPAKIESAAAQIDLSVPGRLQVIKVGSSPSVFIDYAHTPAAIESAISELRARGYSRINLVFSASGDRDHSKRPAMATAAASADHVVVSDYHPRSEDPSVIRAELCTELDRLGASFEQIAEPSEAIAKAISLADAETAVLWCGPGHLKYREVGGKKLPFDPEAAVRAGLAAIA